MSRLCLLATACCAFWSAWVHAQTQGFQPWAGAAVQDWQRAAEATVLTDMAQAEPASALIPMKTEKGRWKVISYEMTNGYKGSMIWASPEAGAPEVSVPLGHEGWYAIFVGLFSATEVPTLAWLRLDDDPAALKRVSRRADGYSCSQELFFKVARLSEDSRLCFGQQSTGDVSACGITHVKLIPLAAAEVTRVEADRKDSRKRVMTATFDGFSDLFYRSPRTEAALLAPVESLRHTDFGTLILQSPGADKVNYPSKVGHMKGSHATEYPRVGDRHFCESVAALAEQGINPIRLLTHGAQEMGMRVYVGIRPAGWSFLEPYTDYWESPFYRDNPQWRCEDRDGTSVARMSWAVPEVRRHCIEVLGELVSFGADGAHLVFNRGYPLVLYEAPARMLFQEEYGVDPRSIPEDDARILEWRAEIVATFMRELRAMLDEEGKRRANGQRLLLSVMVLGTAQDDLRYGVDLAKLIDDGLVDEVFTERGFGRTSDDYNLTFLRDACALKGIPYSPGMTCVPRWYGAIPSYYDHGAHGITIWDADMGKEDNVFEWACVCRFGHQQETRWRLKHLDFSKPPRTICVFKRLGDQIRDGRFGPFWGG